MLVLCGFNGESVRLEAFADSDLTLGGGHAPALRMGLYDENDTDQQIAEMLSCSVGNSKSQLYKARLRFRELLASSVESRWAVRHGQSSPRKRPKPKPENWNLRIGHKVGVRPAPLVSQLQEQTL